MAPYGFIAILFVIADRLLKSLARTGIHDKPIKILSDLFIYNFAKNFRLAFSLPFPRNWAIILISIILTALLYYYLILLRRNHHAEAGVILIIISGAATNLYDRLVYGYVIDYLDLKYFTVFNLGDVMIVGGIIGLFIFHIKKKTAD